MFSVNLNASIGTFPNFNYINKNGIGIPKYELHAIIISHYVYDLLVNLPIFQPIPASTPIYLFPFLTYRQ